MLATIASSLFETSCIKATILVNIPRHDDARGQPGDSGGGGAKALRAFAHYFYEICTFSTA